MRDAVHTGGCQCGAVRLAAKGEPMRSSACHCRMCQRAVGNVFAPLVEFPSVAVTWTGEPTVWASSNVAERGFCAACGTPLFLRALDGDTVEVMSGALDDPSGFPLDYHYGVESMVGWLRLDDGLERRPTRDADLSTDGRAVVSRQAPEGA